MKDGSRRLKDEFVRTIGAGGEGSIDPVLDYRTQRSVFSCSVQRRDADCGLWLARDSLMGAAAAMLKVQSLQREPREALEGDDALQRRVAGVRAGVRAPHALVLRVLRKPDAGLYVDISPHSTLYSPEEADYGDAKSLAQSALRLEEIHQSLHANVYSSAHNMQLECVARSIQELRKNNAGLQKQIQVLKQRLIDYDSVRRSAEAQKKGSPDFERMQQRQQIAEAGLVTLTNEINVELNAIEGRRGTDMKNELLTVVACQLFIHSRAQEHFQQLLPLLPGIARPLLQIAEYSRARPRVNPGAPHSSDGSSVGVIAYAGAESRGVIDRPLQYHHQQQQQQRATGELVAASVHPLQALQFSEIHFAEKLAIATYGGR